MAWTPEDEAKLAELKRQLELSKRNPEAQAFRERFAKNPEVAETPYGEGQQQGLEYPTVDPIDLLPMQSGMNVAKSAVSGLAEKTGLSQIPGRLMSRAVNTKYVPQIGQTLVDEGLIGTKGMLQGQIANKAAAANSGLTEAVKSIPGQVDSLPVAQGVSDLSRKFSTSSGMVPNEVMPEVNKITETALDIAGRGKVSPQEALELKRIAGRVGYNKDKPLASLTAKIAQQEGAGYGKALEEAYGAANPGAANAVAQNNAKLTALIKGERGLAKETPFTLWSLIKGSPVLDSPLLNSVGAQASDKIGAAVAPTLGVAGVRGVSQGLSNAVSRGGTSTQESWTPEDDAQLEALKNAYNELQKQKTRSPSGN